MSIIQVINNKIAEFNNNNINNNKSTQPINTNKQKFYKVIILYKQYKNSVAKVIQKAQAVVAVVVVVYNNKNFKFKIILIHLIDTIITKYLQ